MFDIGWQELFIVAVLALIVVGPKDLPKTIKKITTWIRKARMMARDFQSGVDEMVREADLDDVKKQLTQGTDGLKKDLEDTVGPDLTEDFDLTRNDADASRDTPTAEPLGDAGEAAATDAAPDLDDDVMPIGGADDEAQAPTEPKT